MDGPQTSIVKELFVPCAQWLEYCSKVRSAMNAGGGGSDHFVYFLDIALIWGRRLEGSSFMEHMRVVVTQVAVVNKKQQLPITTNSDPYWCVAQFAKTTDGHSISVGQ